MIEDRDKDIDSMDFSDDDDDDLRYTGYRPQKRSSSLAGRLPMKWVLIGGACFILVLIISISLSGRGGRISADEFNYLRSAIDRIEHQVAAMETIAQRVELMERQETELRDSIRNMNQTLGSLSQRLATVTEKVESARSAAPAPAHPASPAPEQGGIVHEVQPGETLYAIAKRYNVTIDDLVRINKLGGNLTIHPGQKLVVRR